MAPRLPPLLAVANGGLGREGSPRQCRLAVLDLSRSCRERPPVVSHAVSAGPLKEPDQPLPSINNLQLGCRLGCRLLGWTRPTAGTREARVRRTLEICRWGGCRMCDLWPAFYLARTRRFRTKAVFMADDLIRRNPRKAPPALC